MIYESKRNVGLRRVVVTAFAFPGLPPSYSVLHSGPIPWALALRSITRTKPMRVGCSFLISPSDTCTISQFYWNGRYQTGYVRHRYFVLGCDYIYLCYSLTILIWMNFRNNEIYDIFFPIFVMEIKSEDWTITIITKNIYI